MTERNQTKQLVRANNLRSATDLQAMTRLQEVGAFCAHADNTFNECLHEILKAAIALTGAEKGNIQLIDESRSLKIAAQSGFDEAFLNYFATVRPGHAAVCEAAMKAARRVIVENVTQSEIFAGRSALKVLLEAGVYAVQSTPLVSTTGTMLGMISTHFIEPHQLAERELRLMDLLARQAANYLERKQAEKALSQSQLRLSDELERMSRLHAISVQMAHSDDFHSLLQQILTAAADFTATDKGNIQLLDSNTGKLRIIVQQGLGKRFIEYFADHGWVATGDGALQKAERVIMEDLANEPSIQGTVELEIALEDGVRAVQSTPLICRDGRLLGMLNNHFREVHRPSEIDLRYLDLLARMSADLIDRAQAQEHLRESEKQVRHARDYAEATLRTSPVPLLVLDGDLCVVSGNDAFYDVFKFTPQETTGRAVYELGNREWNIPRLRELLESILQDQSWFRDFEVTHQFEHIGKRTMLLNARRMEVAAGGVERIVLVIEDVTARKRAEAERERLLNTEHELRQVAEEANRLKDEFLAIMSHELRNPLNVILGYSELLFRSEELSRSPQLVRMTDSIRRNALTQARLIRDLLDLSRLRSGKISLNTETVSMAVTVNNAVETVRADADAKNITIEVVAIREPLFIEGDPVRLEQIVWNLLNNAVKFTPSGGRIYIRLDQKDNQVFLTVQDTGRGIEPAFLPHVFEMFRQADASTSRADSGMGVGLAIVQQLVQLHSGAISAFSAGPGEGATFSLQLPLSLQPKTSPVSTPNLDASLKNLSILVVDDSQDTTEMLATILSLNGAEVIPVTSGDEALRVIGEREFDVILSDIAMPEMDGFEFLKRLRQIPGNSDVPVLALTGFGRPEDIERARSEGFFSHVTKPFELDSLIGVLRTFQKKR